MVAARSRRQRKDISYKFEEFDEMISAAVEDDIKAPLPPVQHKRGSSVCVCLCVLDEVANVLE